VTAELNPAMAWDRLQPPERGGDVAQRLPLKVESLRRLELDELVIRDDDLPAAGGATLFWLERAEAAWVAWAAKIEGERAIPWLVTARRLRLERPDPSLLALIAWEAPEATPDNAADSAGPADAAAGTDDAGVIVTGEPRSLEPMPRALACICRERSVEAVYRSADEGWSTLDEVKRRTGVAFGECQGRRCVAAIAARLDQRPGERGARLTSRPPLLPVPASVLAAFADL
jgi:bacterioferritin-associated ferredoxin